MPLNPDIVHPMSPGDRVRLGTGNGFGTTMLGPTRPDADGGRFMTRWAVAAGLPVYPLDRFYLAGPPTQTADAALGTYQRTRTTYPILGRAAGLRADEIALTYLLSWIVGPFIVLGPLWVFFTNVDQLADAIGILVVIALFIVLLFGTIFFAVWARTQYDLYLAPLRAPVSPEA